MHRRASCGVFFYLSGLCHSHSCGAGTPAAARHSGAWLPPPNPGASFGYSLFRAVLLRLGFTFAIDRLLSCGQITIVLFHEGRSGVIRPLECLHVGIAVLFENVGQPVHPAVDLLF